MQQRVTLHNLDGCCEVLNELLGLPVQPWKDGKSQPGCIHIDSGFGLFDVAQMSNESGGTRSLSGAGTKREAHAWLCAAIRGVHLAQETA